LSLLLSKKPKPSASSVLEAYRSIFSCSLSNLTVSTFKNYDTFFASAVLLKVGLLTKSRIRAIGMTVNPQAPQHARIGYPIMQKKAIKKQTIVIENSKYIGTDVKF
jgi:hypothetical protein